MGQGTQCSNLATIYVHKGTYAHTHICMLPTCMHNAHTHVCVTHKNLTVEIVKEERRFLKRRREEEEGRKKRHSVSAHFIGHILWLK